MSTINQKPIGKTWSITHIGCLLVFALLVGCGSHDNASKLNAVVTQGRGTSGNVHIHELIQERYPDTISLPDLMRQLPGRSEAAGLIEQVAKLILVGMGIDIRSDMSRYDAINHPEVLLDLLQFTSQQLDAGRKFIVEMAKRRIPLQDENAILPAILQVHNQLPETLDYQQAEELRIELLPTEPPPPSKTIYLGFLRNAAEDESQIKRNVIISEVVERLSTNLVAERDHQFKVIYNGQTYDRLDHFLSALRENDHEITAIIRHYVAPFIPIYKKTDDGRLLPVAATVFERTGFYDTNQQQEAVLPTLHSEMVFFIKSGKNTHGQAIDAAIQYYQGIPKMGFYGHKNMNLDAWLGQKISAEFAGDEAQRALLLAGYMVDINRTLAHREKLVLDGYGAVGICNDSVAVVQMAIRGEINSYPLMMINDGLLDEIDRRLSQTDQEQPSVDLEVYQTLKHAIKQTPKDMVSEPSALRRLHTSLPWESGKEPFYSVVTARRIIEENLSKSSVH